MRLSLLKKNLRRHCKSVVGIAVLLFLVTLVFNSAYSLFQNANTYVNSEMSRTGYGDLNIWVSNLPKNKKINASVEKLSSVKRVVSYPDVISNYTTRGIQSDSEGVFLKYQAKQKWKFFKGNTNDFVYKPTFKSGNAYVPISFKSLYGTRIGDTIEINLSRDEKQNYRLKVGGFYEDPGLGSTMIGLKNVVVSPQTYNSINRRIQSLGRNTTARSGEMLRIFKNGSISNDGLNNLINRKTNISNYLDYAYSRTTLQSFMVILQQAFAGLLIAFAIVLLVVTILIVSHTIRNSIEQETKELGIYKALGFSSTDLRLQELYTFMIPVIIGIIAGLVGLNPFVEYLKDLNITTLGINFTVRFNLQLIAIFIVSLVVILTLVIVLTTNKITHITPLSIIRQQTITGNKVDFEISKKHLVSSLAIKQILTNKRRYLSAMFVALLLTFSLMFVGRINAWLGPTGQGMMDAFNPQDHDLGIQTFGRVPQDEIDDIIKRYSRVTATYELAMPKLALDGVNYTANVSTAPERFHILAGHAPAKSNEVVITEFLARDINKKIGDYVTVQNRGRSARYHISGFYQCANDMGSNFGMSRAGYLRIANDDPRIWCHHYFLANKSANTEIFNYLSKRYGDRIHVHENTWPGLFGILSSMHSLIIGMYVVIAIISLITVILISQRILQQEAHDLALYKALGFNSNLLQVSYAIRFLVISFIGAILGTVLATGLSDPIAGRIMSIAGIADFHSHLNLVQMLIPIITVTLLFTIFAYYASKKIKQISVTRLINE